jgi:ParB family chromosome partitioning protein
MKEKSIVSIPIHEINILNPRTRNQAVAEEIRHNICGTSLKRPITVRQRENSKNGKKYDLVCGQGRLEAFIEAGEEEIPALVITTNRETALIMSLAENIARRNNNSLELLNSIKYLKNKGYEENEIATKTGLGRDYIHGIIKLLDTGEERLVNSVEKGRMPLGLALKIAKGDDAEIQRILTEAFESDELNSSQLLAAKKLVDRRKYCGKSLKSLSKQNVKFSSKKDLVTIFENDLKQKRRLVTKSNYAKEILLFIKTALNKLLHDIHFINQLKAEGVNNFPQLVDDFLKRID